MKRCFGVSSYFLWTQKGTTVLPLVRGSGFLVRVDLSNAFFRYHVLTAGHVACPVKFPGVFGGGPGLQILGERHISCGLLVPQEALSSGPSSATSPTSSMSSTPLVEIACYFPQKRYLNCDTASLRIKDERSLLFRYPKLDEFAVDVSTEPVARGEALVCVGMKATEAEANASDNDLKLEEVTFEAISHAAFISRDFGNVVLMTGTERPHASMSGGPVFRKRDGKCVGVLCTPVMNKAPPMYGRRNEGEAAGDRAAVPAAVRDIIREPWLDISSVKALRGDADQITAAFVPIHEFAGPMRRQEI